MSTWKYLCTIESTQSKMSNGGWAYDAYPELETLDAHSRITIADLKGPGVITCTHSSQSFQQWHMSPRKPESPYSGATLGARGVILEIYYNDVPTPAVRVPLGDFFADGCGGKPGFFGNQLVEKENLVFRKLDHLASSS